MIGVGVTIELPDTDSVLNVNNVPTGAGLLFGVVVVTCEEIVASRKNYVEISEVYFCALAGRVYCRSGREGPRHAVRDGIKRVGPVRFRPFEDLFPGVSVVVEAVADEQFCLYRLDGSVPPQVRAQQVRALLL